MPKFIFYVQIQSQGAEQLDLVDEDDEEFTKLKDITVTLVPFRDSELSQNIDDPAMTNMSSKTRFSSFKVSRASYRVRPLSKGPRPVSGKIRPISAYSNVSNRPMSGYNRRPQTSQVPTKKKYFSRPNFQETDDGHFAEEQERRQEEEEGPDLH
jgi:hypothetical protein